MALKVGDRVVVDDADPDGWGRFGVIVEVLPDDMYSVDVRGNYPVLRAVHELGVVEGADGPRFTGNFDWIDYESFFLSVSSALGTDESVSVEQSAKMAVKIIERNK